MTAYQTSCRDGWRRLAASVGVAGAVACALAQTWPLPAGADTFRLANPTDGVIGVPFYVKSHASDTLLDIGRPNELGYQDMEQANPKVDVWVPGEGSDVLIPTFFVLPDAPHSGLVLNRPEMRLYYYPPDKPNEVQSYPISIGREGWHTPLGNFSIVKKVKDPTWTPPPSIRAEHAASGDILPEVVPAGPDNPLGPYALRLSIPGYLIHGTNKPWGLGMQVSHGCIRMNNEGIEELFPQVTEGTSVAIVDQPYKFGWLGDDLYMEVHIDNEDKRLSAYAVVPTPLAEAPGVEIDWRAIDQAIAANEGVPMLVGTRRSASALNLDRVF